MSRVCLVFVVALCGRTQAAAAAAPASLTSIPQRWSADGSTLFFARSDSALRPWGIRSYAYRGDGSLVELTDDGRPGYVVPAPAAGRVAVLTSEFDLVVAEPGGSRVTVADNAIDPAWSPDGLRLAYVSGDGNLNGQVFVFDTGSRQSRKLGYGNAPVWSPDGTRIAASDEDFITLFDVQANQQLPSPTQGYGDPGSPVWSPDGTTVAFASGEGQRRTLYVFSLALRRSRTVARRVESVLAWSPDGRTIVYTWGEMTRAVRADGSGGDRLVESGPRLLTVAPDWSRSAFSVPSWHGYDVYVADWPTRSPHRIGPSQCTVVTDPCRAGSDAVDRMRGGATRDVILAGAGDDAVEGLGGNDRIEGGLGGDTLWGGLGQDFVFGGTGSDRLFGGPEADRLDGDAGADRLTGGTGRDSLWGGSGPDVVSGGDGNDFVVVRDGERDRVDCGAGRDRVIADPLDVLIRCERISRRRV